VEIPFEEPKENKGSGPSREIRDKLREEGIRSNSLILELDLLGELDLSPLSLSLPLIFCLGHLLSYES
jgi:hypothetical protein